MKMRVCWRSAVPLLAALCVIAGLAGSMPGGVTKADLTDPLVKNALKFAVSEYNKASIDTFARKVINVIDATEQVVEGMKYSFTVKIGCTSCKKGSVKDLGMCALQKVAKTLTCTFEVWSRPWLPDTRLTTKMCK